MRIHPEEIRAELEFEEAKAAYESTRATILTFGVCLFIVGSGVIAYCIYVGLGMA